MQFDTIGVAVTDFKTIERVPESLVESTIAFYPYGAGVFAVVAPLREAHEVRTPVADNAIAITVHAHPARAAVCLDGVHTFFGVGGLEGGTHPEVVVEFRRHWNGGLRRHGGAIEFNRDTHFDALEFPDTSAAHDLCDPAEFGQCAELAVVACDHRVFFQHLHQPAAMVDAGGYGLF